jgi:dynein heavy chain 1
MFTDAIKFGYSIVVEDADVIGPSLNSVLNREVRKDGQSKVIYIEDKEVPYFDNFQLFMITRNANARFTPDLCSRVTFVNFTVT